MKKGRYRAAMTICPFYRFHENKTVPSSVFPEKLYRIYCEGVHPKNSVCQSFTTPADRKDYERSFCRCDWKSCWISKAHLQELGNNDD